jgi:hypothetical protein
MSGALQITVDRTHLIAWLDGVLIDMRGGVGLIVNEVDCIAAKDGLDRGETVLLREGNTMTGTCLRLVDGNYEESAL